MGLTARKSAKTVNLMYTNLPSEFKLLIDLCSHHIDQSSIVHATNKIDWNKFTLLLQKHRLTFLTSEKINKAGIKLADSVSQELSNLTQKTKFKMLALTAEIGLLSKAFQIAGIPSIYLKGPVAAKQIYNDFTAKNSRDIDVLINESSIEDCLTLLEKDGYQLVYPYRKLNKAQKRYFKKVNNQLALFHPIKKIRLEIHWRLFANQHLLPYNFQELHRNKQTISIGKNIVYGLGEKQLLIYLCVHGAKHAWSKLYWLLEVAILLKKEENLEEIIAEAKTMGVERLIYQAIQLSKRLFDLKFNPELPLEKDTIANYLVEYALEKLKKEEKKSTNNLLEDRNYKANLRQGLKYKLANKKLLSINDFTLISLPSILFFLYYPLRPFLLSWRHFFKPKNVLKNTSLRKN